MRSIWPNSCMILSTLGLLALLTGCPPQGAGPGAERGAGGASDTQEKILPPDPAKVWPPRAVWVVRQVYRSPEEIVELMESCRAAGINTVLFQVRGNGTAYYASGLEPWDPSFEGEPAFDPLAVAVREAHRRGMALHAWVNVMPAWKGKQPPADPKQLYNARPEWFLYDQKGERQPLDDFYVSLNPCLPAVRAYLVSVFEEIVRKYPVDGLHLDYIRFPIEVSPKGSDYPRDQQTVGLFRKATGKRPWEDRAGWTRWRQEQVSQLVADIRQMTRRVRPSLRLTVACAPDFARGREKYYQDGPTWLNRGWVDTVFVMNYTADAQEFARRQEAWRAAAPGRAVAPGISVSIPGSKTGEQVAGQIERSRGWGHGFAIFAGGPLFDGSPRARAAIAAIRQSAGLPDTVSLRDDRRP